jgi:2-dehydro-3-deoxyphosphogluconate aldolase/(4S)-4-hydroxy-2-oxoglutarate aldolase
MLPTGGVSLATVAEFIAAGATALGIGTELVDTKALIAGQDAVLTERSRELVQAVAAARSR